MTIPYNPFQFEPNFYANARPVYRQMRDEAPVYWSKEGNFWALSRYEDIRSAALNPKVFSNAAGGNGAGPIAETFAKYPNLLSFDPPKHGEMRRAISGLLTPNRVNALSDTIRGYIVDLIAKVEDQDSMDLIKDLAEPLPCIVIADFLGIPLDDAKILVDVSDRIANFEDQDVVTAGPAAMEQLAAYFEDAFKTRSRGEPGDDAIWSFVQAEKAGILSHSEAIGFAILVTIAGGETTTKMIGNLAVMLNDNPDQRSILVQSPDLIRNGVEEGLRYNSSTHFMCRTLTQDVELHGETMREGDTVAMLWVSGSNDERKFENPDKFDVRRKLRGDHLAFGAGVHACVGALLARLELVVAFEELLKRWPEFGIDKSGLKFEHNPFTCGYKTVPFLYNK